MFRAWILEKSLPCWRVRSPMTFSMSSSRSLIAWPSILVLSDGDGLQVEHQLDGTEPMYWPTSSTKKFKPEAVSPCCIQP